MSNSESVPEVAPETLKERLRILQNILDNVPSMIGYWDQNLRNKYCNQAYSLYFGKSPSEILGRHISDLLGPSLYQQNLPFLQAALQGTSQTFERDIPGPDGTIRHTQAHYIPDTLEGVVVGVFVLVFDVSFVKKAMKEKALMMEQLSENNKMVSLGEMAGGIAHEINTPLAIISTNASLIESILNRKNPDTELLKSRLLTIRETTERIAKIVKALLKFSRDRSRSEVAEVTVSSIFEDTLPLCREKFLAHGVSLLCEAPDESLRTKCNTVEVSQILINLLNNAFDAVIGVEPKWVRLGALDMGAEIEIFVENSGPPIPPEIRQKIMEPFFTTKEVGKGTGLGLSMAKGIAETHGGSLELSPESLHTRFILRLPRLN